MGVWYQLYNATRRERISFMRAGGSNRRELAGNPVSAAIVAYYLVSCSGDSVFIGGDKDAWLRMDMDRADAELWPDVEARVINELEVDGVLTDRGPLLPDDPDVHVHRFELRWISKAESGPVFWPPPH